MLPHTSGCFTAHTQRICTLFFSYMPGSERENHLGTKGNSCLGVQPLCFVLGGACTTWMSQEVSKWLVSGFLTYILINVVYWGYNPFTNHLLTSCNIQVYA